MKTDLAPQEAASLKKHVDRIKRGLATVWEIGESLSAIRDDKLYRASHATFEAFCIDEFNIQRRHAYRLIEAAGVRENVSKRTQKPPKLPTSESQVRALAPLTAEEQAEAWEEACQEDEQPTAAKVKEVVERRKKEADPEPDAEDDLGNVIGNKAVAAVFADRGRLKSVAADIERICQVLKGMADEPLCAFLDIPDVVAELRKAKGYIAKAMPYALIPPGVKEKKYRDIGWLPKYNYENGVSPEMHWKAGAA